VSGRAIDILAVVGRALLIVACLLLLAGCGSGKSSRSSTCTSPKEQRALARLQRDLAAIKRAAALPSPDSLKGNPAVNKATDAFLLHVATAPIGNLKRNRMIDHAASLLLGSCQQCFQALEAARPIPGIAHGDLGCPSSVRAPAPDRLRASAAAAP
jgi:hypothetical protein